MGRVYLNDIAYWVEQWRASGDLISTDVARRIAEYWQGGAETGALALLALDGVMRDDFLDDVDSTIRYVRSAGGQFETTIGELYALRAWGVYWHGTPRH